ncbi:MAG: RNA polymerase sigma factor [Bacteroidota bacterium]
MIVTDRHPEPQWEQLYAAYADELAAFVAARVDADEAQDLLQEVWASLAISLDDQIIENPRAWLYRITRNRITDHYRKVNGRPAFQDLTPDLDAEATYSDYPDPDEAWEEIDAALEALPEAQREVFVRNELDGETLREIAEDLSLPLKTVISRKGYARQRLRAQLRELYEDYFGE